MKSSFKFHIGNIVVCLEGSGAIYDEIIKEMSFFPETETNLTPDIIYQFLDRGIMNEDEIRSFNKFKTRFYDIYVSTKIPNRVILLQNLPLKDRLIRYLPENIQRALYGIAIRRLLSFNELLSAAFFYDVFLWTSLSVLLEQGGTYLHAGSIADVDGAYIFAGPQQSGKTTIINSFLLKDRRFYLLSNDKVIIDNTGKAYSCEGYINAGPRTFLLSDETMDRMFKNLSVLEKFIWRLFKAIKSTKGIAKRIYFSETYNNGAITKATIRYCFYLKQIENGVLKLSKMKNDDFAIRTSRDIISEVEDMIRYTGMSGDDRDRLREKILDVCKRSIANVECFELLIPYKTPPAEVRDFINDIINKESNLGWRETYGG